MTQFFWDTNLFIYQWEADSPFRPSVRDLRQKMLTSGVGLVTSTMALGEVMTKPRMEGQEELALRYQSAIRQSATIVPFDEKTADLYATIRAEYRVKPPDAIQLASAASHGVELFITNDDKLWKLRIPGIHFVVSIATALSLVP